MPPDLLLTGLTGEQWASMRRRYSRLPTPLERIEKLLSLIQYTIGNMFAEHPPEFKNIIPPRGELWADSFEDDNQSVKDEDAMIENMKLHMYVFNTIQGDTGASEWALHQKSEFLSPQPTPDSTKPKDTSTS